MTGRDLFTRVVLPHLLFAPVAGYYVHRAATRNGHPTPGRQALRYGILGLPGVLLYEFRNRGDNEQGGDVSQQSG